MGEYRIVAVLPSEVSDELIVEGVAGLLPTTRTGLPLADIAVTGLAVLTTTITVENAASALEDLVRRLAAWRHRTKLDRDPTVSIEAVGPSGRISLRLTNTTDEQELAHAVSLVLARPSAAAQGDTEPDEAD